MCGCELLERIRAANALPTNVAANTGPDLFHANRTVAWQMSLPCSNNRFSSFRGGNAHRAYLIATSRITSGDELKRRNRPGGSALDLRLMRLRRQLSRFV